MASRAAFRGEDPEFWHYAAAKAGIVAMTRTIARQYGRQGITAFALAPGYVDTDFNRPFAEKFGVEAAARDTGLGEVAQPQDVANVIAFLASGLARHATGTTIDINSASTCGPMGRPRLCDHVPARRRERARSRMFPIGEPAREPTTVG